MIRLNQLLFYIYNIKIGISLVLVTSGTPPPKGALCLGEQKADLAGDGEKKLWSVICDGAEHGHGKIPGKNLNELGSHNVVVLMKFKKSHTGDTCHLLWKC